MANEVALKTVIVTGANSGIGFEICRRLLAIKKDNFHIILACRNRERGEKAVKSLENEFSDARLELVLCDTSDVGSVLRFCKEVKLRHRSIHLLFCNAGILLNNGVAWSRAFLMFLTHPVVLANSADIIEQRVGGLTDVGLGKVFAVNVFGHYVMMRELEGVLEQSGEGRIIWTSSLTSEVEYFDAEDYQGIKSKKPYESSKWLTDILSIYMDAQYRAKGLPIHSFTTHPGVVASSIGDMSPWIVEARKLLHYALRFYGENTQTISATHGILSNVHVAFEPVGSLKPHLRYGSYINRWREEFIGTQVIDGYDEEVARTVVDKMEMLRISLSEKYRV